MVLISDDEVPDVLVVDDDPTARQFLADILRARDYQVRTADGAQSALQAIESRTPDLILLDIQMADMDGIAFCRQLKQLPHMDGVPVIFISAREDIDCKLAAFESGAIDYLTKPFSVAEIQARVKAHLQAKRSADLLSFRAGHDALTGLPNRSLLADRLQQALSYAERYGMQVAIAYIDLDRFKNVNDRLGHEAGDRLLREVSLRLLDCVRESDTVARLGGDEFVVVFHVRGNDNAPVHLMQRILDCVAQPIVLQERRVEPSCSIGLAIYPQDGGDVETLLAHADAALYRAKELGRNNFQFYTRELNERASRRVALETGLRRALECEELVLHYQPRIALRTGSISGFEALIRWQHPDLGLLLPQHFLPIAEEAGLSDRVGAWVLRTACRQLKRWQAQGLPLHPVTLNISGTQFLRIGFARNLEAVLQETGIAPRLIELDFKEGLLMQDPLVTLRILEQLRQLGVGLSIDDFGTGFSNFSHLKRFPVDRIKLDPSFIANIEREPEDLAMVEAVITLAHSLGMRVAAECTERGSQLALLAERGCDEMQGEYFSPAVSGEECDTLLRDGRALDLARLGRRAATPTLLFLEGGSAPVEALQAWNGSERCRLLRAEDADAALSLLASQEVNVVVCDPRDDGAHCIDFLQRVRQMYPRTTRIMLAPAADTRLAFDAINLGAVFRFLPSPCQPEVLAAAIDDAFAHSAQLG